MSDVAAKELKVQIKQRSSVRANSTKELKKIDPLFHESPPNTEEAKIVQLKLSEYQDRLKLLDKAILVNIEGEKLDEEIERCEEYQSNIMAGPSTIQTRLEATTLTPARSLPPASPSNLNYVCDVQAAEA